MTRINSLQHEFVSYIPDALDDGVLYVSMPFATVLHRCCCGCGSEVVTPLDPTDWQMTFDGKSVSVHPSIGNWSLTCQSHYWIHRNQVQWARRLSKYEIAVGRFVERVRKLQRFGDERVSLQRLLLKWIRRSRKF